jgi:hypothetical protein
MYRALIASFIKIDRLNDLDLGVFGVDEFALLLFLRFKLFLKSGKAGLITKN